MPQFPTYIFGLHDPGGEQHLLNAGKPGWITIAVKVNPPDHDGDFSQFANRGLGVIVRLNNGYGSPGTIPHSTQYDAFAQQCAAFVAGSRGAKIWIVGNETNLAWERPGNDNGVGGEVITPDRYAQCFAKCRAAIKSLPGHRDDWVIPAPVAPWNTQTTYASNPSGDWVKYFQDLLTQCVQLHAPPDALALHTYTHGFDAAFITSEQKMGPPFSNYHYHFRTYRDFLSVVPVALRTVPVFITETQPADPDWWQNRNVGWIQAAYAEIHAWNSVAAHQPIQALCLFRWLDNPWDPDGWSISNRPALVDDLRAALQNEYRVRWQTSPAPSDPVTAAAIVAAKQYTWMPINTDAALYKFAQAHNLGYPQTDEFHVTVGSDVYVAQVFNLGIVYAKQGDWGNVKWMKKPGE